ncbi:MAG TPA: GDP-L-fucose synthase [Bacillota bacterium]|nr:GDP-L-fucose synthase [Bacillota bacterium]
MSFWTGKKVVVTGGAGFLGSYVVEELKAKDCKSVFIPRSKDYDLTDERNIKIMYENAEPDIIIHLAAAVGGIGANERYPGTFFYKNAVMGIQLMELARQYGIKKFITIGTTCSYPKHAAVPFKEEDLWNGYPAEVTAPYGLAKKMLFVQSQAYEKEFCFNSINLIPVNLYGPRDNFNPDTSHVIPALIKRFVDAAREGTKEVVCWGTGEASREFIYAKDCAEAIIMAAERYNSSEPVNIGTGKEIKIKELVGIIAALTGYKGSIAWDTSKPDGQPRRCVDTSKARERFGFEARTDFREGLRNTIEWYKEYIGG